MANLIELDLVVHRCVCQGLTQGLQRVLSNVFLLLERLTDSDRVVGPIAQGEEGRCCGLVQLGLEGLRAVEAVQLDRAGVALALVEFFAHELGEHLVHSQVRQEAIVLFQQLPLVLVLLEVSLQLVEANHFRDAGDVQILNLVFEFSGWVLDDDADARVLVLCYERIVNLDHLGLG